MSYLLVAGAVLALVLWSSAPARRLLRRAQWRIGSSALAIGVLAAAAFVAVRGGPIEGLLLAVIGVMVGVSSRWPRATQRRDTQPGMGLDEARAILGVDVGASPADVQAAYARLMRRAHPDQGGSTGLATQLNVARDRLLKG